MTKRTAWKCEACQRRGVITHASDALVYDVVEQLKSAHAAKDDDCALVNGLDKVRITERRTER
jgi:fructosamine-3-kinase